MLADIPLGRDATATEVRWARTEDVSVLPIVEDLEERRRKCVNYNIFQIRKSVSSGVTYGTPHYMRRRQRRLFLLPGRTYYLLRLHPLLTFSGQILRGYVEVY